MKKFMKITALSLAMALVFGMTVSAAPSVNKDSAPEVIAENAKEDVKEAPAEIKAEEVAEPAGEEKAAAESTAKELSKTVVAADSKSVAQDLKKADGTTVKVEIKVAANDVTVAPLAPVVVKKVEKVVTQVKNTVAASVAKADKEVKEVKAVAGADVKVDKTAAIEALMADAGISKEEATAFIQEKGVTLTVATGITVDFNKSYLLYHLNEATNVWENIPYTGLTADGKFTANFKSLSPVTVIEVTTAAKAGDDNDNDSNDNSDDTTTAAPVAETAVSPKTGENLPVAVIMAVICLAAVAVFAAKKVKFND